MDNSIDLQFVEYIVKSLVGNPDAVKIARTIDEKGVLLELTVDPEDLGRVIGKRGATAQSLRTLLRALGTKNDARYNLKIVDNGEPRPPREDRQDDRRDNRDEHDGHEGRREDDRSTNNDDQMGSNGSSSGSGSNDDNWSSAPTAPAEDTKDEDHSDALSKTRQELADLDDLDV